jgi:hypothetical protein
MPIQFFREGRILRCVAESQTTEAPGPYFFVGPDICIFIKLSSSLNRTVRI